MTCPAINVFAKRDAKASVAASSAKSCVKCVVIMTASKINNTSALATTPFSIKAEMARLSADIKTLGLALGFNEIGITDTHMPNAEERHIAWLKKGYHGEMDYMAKHGVKRTRPEALVPNTLRVISARLDYLPPNAADSEAILNTPDKAYISRYALGRDYHKVMRNKLQRLSEHIQERVITLNAALARSSLKTDILPFEYRVFTDSAPVLEVALAEKAGLGWRGKHTLLINKKQGSWFFLGEIYTNLPLTIDQQAENHCGTCTSCIDVCPTQAIVAPYEVDARRCISYLTIYCSKALNNANILFSKAVSGFFI